VVATEVVYDHMRNPGWWWWLGKNIIWGTEKTMKNNKITIT